MNQSSVNIKLTSKSTNKVFPCSLCGIEYKNYASMRKHLNRTHNVFKPRYNKVSDTDHILKQRQKRIDYLKEYYRTNISKYKSHERSLNNGICEFWKNEITYEKAFKMDGLYVKIGDNFVKDFLKNLYTVYTFKQTDKQYVWFHTFIHDTNRPMPKSTDSFGVYQIVPLFSKCYCNRLRHIGNDAIKAGRLQPNDEDLEKLNFVLQHQELWHYHCLIKKNLTASRLDEEKANKELFGNFNMDFNKVGFRTRKIQNILHWFYVILYLLGRNCSIGI